MHLASWVQEVAWYKKEKEEEGKEEEDEEEEEEEEEEEKVESKRKSKDHFLVFTMFLVCMFLCHSTGCLHTLVTTVVLCDLQITNTYPICVPLY